eukprot:g1124.t1
MTESHISSRSTALKRLTEQLGALEKSKGKNHPDLLETLTELAVVTAVVGNFEGALALQRRHLLISEKENKISQGLGRDKKDSTNVIMARSLHLLGKILWAQKRNVAETEKQYRRALEVLELCDSRSSTVVETEAEVLSSLANVLVGDKNARGQYYIGKELNRKSLELFEVLQLQKSELPNYSLDVNFVAEDKREKERVEQRKRKKGGLGSTHLRSSKSNVKKATKNVEKVSEKEDVVVVKSSKKSEEKENSERVTEGNFVLVSLTSSSEEEDDVSGLFNKKQTADWESFLAVRQGRNLHSKNETEINNGLKWRAQQLLDESSRRLVDILERSDEKSFPIPPKIPTKQTKRRNKT